jgi:hypothetical protein
MDIEYLNKKDYNSELIEKEIPKEISGGLYKEC